MRDGSERVWLSGVVRDWLRRMRADTGVSLSGFIRGCVMERLQGERNLEGELKRLLLDRELGGLLGESAGLRKMQNSILADFVYLRDYARELMKGAYKNPACVQLRRSVLTYPGADKALPALERVFRRREQIGQRLCEILGELYPDLRYEDLDSYRSEYVSEHEQPSRSLRGEKVKHTGGETWHG